MAYIDTDDFLGLFYVASAGQDKQFINTVEMVVNNTPAADVTKIKHGRWEICCDGYYPYCSNCKTEPQGREMTDYCPHCGAKMDGNKKMTNYDRIKAMSVEEMAREEIYFVPNNEDFHYTGLSGKYRKTSREVIEDNIEWLEQEVSEDEI